MATERHVPLAAGQVRRNPYNGYHVVIVEPLGEQAADAFWPGWPFARGVQDIDPATFPLIRTMDADELAAVWAGCRRKR